MSHWKSFRAAVRQENTKVGKALPGSRQGVRNGEGGWYCLTRDATFSNHFRPGAVSYCQRKELATLVSGHLVVPKTSSNVLHSPCWWEPNTPNNPATLRREWSPHMFRAKQPLGFQHPIRHRFYASHLELPTTEEPPGGCFTAGSFWGWQGRSAAEAAMPRRTADGEHRGPPRNLTQATAFYSPSGCPASRLGSDSTSSQLQKKPTKFKFLNFHSKEKKVENQRNLKLLKANQSNGFQTFWLRIKRKIVLYHIPEHTWHPYYMWCIHIFCLRSNPFPFKKKNPGCSLIHCFRVPTNESHERFKTHWIRGWFFSDDLRKIVLHAILTE